MGLSSSKTKTTSSGTESLAPNAAYAPAIDAGAAALKPAYDAASANNTKLLGGINNSIDYYQGVQNGDYLKGNPYLQSVLDKSNADITNSVNSRFEGAGRYGSGQSSAILAKALSDNENQVRYQDYNTERGYQNNAGTQIGALTGISASLPQAASSQYAQDLANLLGKYATGTNSGTNTQTGGPGLLGSLLSVGGQLGAAAITKSDRRLKWGVKLIGLLPDGLPVYSWKYLWSRKRWIGPMAQDVAKFRPWALGPRWHGFLTIIPGAL